MKAIHRTSLLPQWRTALPFLSPRLLESLCVPADPATLPLFRDLLVSGCTAPDLLHRKSPAHRSWSAAQPDVWRPARGSPIRTTGRYGPLDEAEAESERQRDALSPVKVI